MLRVPRARVGALVVVVVVLAAAVFAPGSTQGALPKGATPKGDSDAARYTLAGGCYGLRSQATNRFVARAPGNSFRASGAEIGDAEPFRMQATSLGHYLFYGKVGDYLAASAGFGGSIEAADIASDAADWRVNVAGPNLFRITLPTADKTLVASGDGELSIVSGNGGDPALFAFAKREDCATYPEVETNVSGTPRRGSTPYTEVAGFLDGHLHHMAFEFLGGRAHCGRPWHRYGAPYALVDCPDHGGDGAGAALENTASYGNPVGTHDPVGWPTFKDWPHHKSLTHEQTYYKWVERAWRGGLRVFVNLLVENEVLCEVYPLKQNSCNEMNSVRLQARRARELEDYIDAQSGGPGKGWYRIVKDPFEARRVINDGKLAVILGMEVSTPFDCGVSNGEPTCDVAQLDRGIEEVWDLGIRQLELVNKFDNALTGVAGDEGSTGAEVNGANFLKTGRFWDLKSCADNVNTDRSPLAPTIPHNSDDLAGNVFKLVPPGAAPVYPTGPHCNSVGLSPLGEHAIKRLIEKGALFDPDHMSVVARDQALKVVERERYPGVMSSHSWSTDDSYRRIYRLGGVITPYGGSAGSFAAKWQRLKKTQYGAQYYGIGWGADMNGFGSQGAPRQGPNPVAYPFKSFDGKATIDRQRSGSRVFDINADGVAHYGLFPDWVQDLRNIAGDGIVNDLSRGAEAYLQMWERAAGVPAGGCRSAKGRVTRKGLERLRLHSSPKQLLRRAGQPARRVGRSYRYCIKGKANRKARLAAVFTPRGRVGLVASTKRGNTARGVGVGASSRRLKGRTKAFGSNVRVRSAGGRKTLVYGVRNGKVRYVAVATRSVAKTRKSLGRYLRLARLR